MSQLLVMRHAKSSWKTGRIDHDRPLNARGRRDAARMALALQQAEFMPTWIACSSAERTRETLAFLEDAWCISPPSEIIDTLYLPSLRAMLDAIGSAPQGAERVLLLSHNPGCEQLVQWLTGTVVTMTTANVAVISIRDGVPWAEVISNPAVHTLDTVLRPRELDD